MIGPADRPPKPKLKNRESGEAKMVGVRMQKEELALLKAFMALHVPQFRSRSVALRHLLEPGLAEARKTVAGAPLAQK